MDSIDALEALARSMLDDGLASTDVQLALDRLIADRANGEAVDEAVADLRSAVLASAGDVAGDDSAH